MNPHVTLARRTCRRYEVRRDLVGAAEAASELGTTIRTIRRWVRSGRLPAPQRWVDLQETERIGWPREDWDDIVDAVKARAS